MLPLLEIAAKRLESDKGHLESAIGQLAIAEEPDVDHQRLEQLEKENASLATEAKTLETQLQDQIGKVSKLEAEIRDLSVKEVAYKKTIQAGDMILSMKACPECQRRELEEADLVRRIGDLEKENNDLLDQFEHLRDVQRKFKDLQQTEEFFTKFFIGDNY